MPPATSSLPQAVGKYMGNYFIPKNELSLGQRCATTALLVAAAVVSVFTFASAVTLASASAPYSADHIKSLLLCGIVALGSFSLMLHTRRLLVDFNWFLERKLKETYAEKALDNRDVILWFTAEHDKIELARGYSFSHVLYGSPVPYGISPLIKKFLAWRKGPLFKYQIVCKDVSSLEEIRDMIKNIKERELRIHALWITAHGDPVKFTLQKPNRVKNLSPFNRLVDTIKHHQKGGYGIYPVISKKCNEADQGLEDIDQKWRELIEIWRERKQLADKYMETWRKLSQEQLRECFGQLDEDTTIVLCSCSTGKISATQEVNIAQAIASAVPGRRVIAPFADGGCASIKNLEKMDVTLRGTTGVRDITATFLHQKEWDNEHGERSKRNWIENIKSMPLLNK